MPGSRVPGPLCVTRSDPLDLGTLALMLTPAPQSVCLPPVPKVREWHRLSRAGGFMPAELAISPDGIALLEQVEELHLQPYDDQTADDITVWVKGATIGYGHLIAKDEWTTFEKGITEVEADALFAKDLAPFVEAVSSNIRVGVQQYEFDALVIFAFNIGKAGFAKSSVVKLINDPPAEDALTHLEVAWKAWNKAQGKVMKGLVNRRRCEWQIYTEARYERW